LAQETSPYLRQHADNPVDWHPWGEEAMAEARQRDVPILLSVGYSACHWCHVMAHESFEDADTAALMNELFVNVKVDREERPDVDAIYMEAVQTITGQGGWPMTVFLTADGRPFFGGTYFPKERRGGMPSFSELCRAVDQQWRTNRQALDEQAGRLLGEMGHLARLQPQGGLPPRAALDDAAGPLVGQHDPRWGGFGGPPKFPQAMSIEFLLRHVARTADDAARSAALTSLDAMAAGGMYDHLGGGFARYSVDGQWLVPHFEKMLYDNALLIRAYLHAWQLTGEPRYRQVVEETVGYVLRDLRHSGGAFFSAEDADSEGEEGRFYVWSLREVRDIGGEAAVGWYGVTAQGNFEGHNILNRITHRGELQRPAEVEAARQRLFEARSQRVRPGLDDKALTEWNALMLSSLAEAAVALDRHEWLQAAAATGDFLRRDLRRDDGRWLRSWQQDGGARHLAYASDYAAVIDAFVRLAEATGQARWMLEARRAADGLLELFWDEVAGGVFTTGNDAEQLISRTKDLMDNATPSANSLAAVALARLATLTGEERYRSAAEGIARLIGGLAVQHPGAFAHMLVALDLLTEPPVEVVVTGDRPDLLAVVQGRWLPRAVVAWGEPYPSPLWEGRDEGRAYVCRNYACQLPAAEPAALTAQLLGA
jgi:uncharacterized protein YyaL (SSP411 family)